MTRGASDVDTTQGGAAETGSAFPVQISRRLLITLGSSLIPLAFDAAFLQQLWRMQPARNTLMWEVPGIVVMISWGTFAAICCMLAGVAIGIPAAFLEAIRYRYGSRDKGGTSEIIMIAVPWLITFAAADLIGARWLFPPVAGPLIVVNTLGARAIPSGLAALVRLWSPLVVEDGTERTL